ncbi:YHYH domain-containing protein [Vibrio casei]|uniref:YHYH domain-containing protein n=2 Tax=Vibrio casei TaxID=673372 RepID=A0A368LGL4_9VIBR|nr:YHYH domain-containing protein [Vibrio casei]
MLIFVASNINAQPLNSVERIELSHSGGTDACGCHYNRKTGEYHCHTRKKRGGSCPP